MPHHSRALKDSFPTDRVRQTPRLELVLLLSGTGRPPHWGRTLVPTGPPVTQRQHTFPWASEPAHNRRPRWSIHSVHMPISIEAISDTSRTLHSLLRQELAACRENCGTVAYLGPVRKLPRTAQDCPKLQSLQFLASSISWKELPLLYAAAARWIPKGRMDSRDWRVDDFQDLFEAA